MTRQGWGKTFKEQEIKGVPHASDIVPEDATHYLNGLYYKYGLRGFVYYWNTAKQEWQKSDKTRLGRWL